MKSETCPICGEEINEVISVVSFEGYYELKKNEYGYYEEGEYLIEDVPIEYISVRHRIDGEYKECKFDGNVKTLNEKCMSVDNKGNTLGEKEV